ncbi:prepilin-type N-terminal cleavage/methylation domain-containing protein [Vibrio sp. HDW18]|uniref:GspH/FimT family pseudopilin n=1 Tax=Vibrio sp. HDW18 TaxID=2714948 RepID=UPI0014097B3E|nr:Tfp pilus assembly protein FimT/FimU [Vibrio sp. HDW18]QIL86050.1 prepilin-type N-terminal cleavage/methylation domain-containing protein [Vibrio sp. HDW18]
MHRGFTLLELLITVAVLTTLLLFAAPNFSQINQQSKMVNLANELQGFLIQAKSEAVLRNQNLWVHMQGLPSATGDWVLRLASVEGVADITEHNTLAVLQGARYRNVLVSSTGTLTNLKFDPVMGNPQTAGSMVLKQTELDANPIKVIVHNRAGRIRVCADNEAKYGFEKC